jgi:hypothetical protein
VRADAGDGLVKEIMEEFIANLGKGLVDTNIFSQPVIQCDALGGSGLPLTLRTRGLSGPLSRSDHIRRTRRTAK